VTGNNDLSYTNPFGYNRQMTQQTKRSTTTAVVPSTLNTADITAPDNPRHDGWTRERMIAFLEAVAGIQRLSSLEMREPRELSELTGVFLAVLPWQRFAGDVPFDRRVSAR
jgi:hypothetical protein